jgi:hypothetical protein
MKRFSVASIKTRLARATSAPLTLPAAARMKKVDIAARQANRRIGETAMRLGEPIFTIGLTLRRQFTGIKRSPRPTQALAAGDGTASLSSKIDQESVGWVERSDTHRAKAPTHNRSGETLGYTSLTQPTRHCHFEPKARNLSFYAAKNARSLAPLEMTSLGPWCIATGVS